MKLIFLSEVLKDSVVLFKRIITTFSPASTHPNKPERFNTVEFIAVAPYGSDSLKFDICAFRISGLQTSAPHPIHQLLGIVC